MELRKAMRKYGVGTEVLLNGKMTGDIIATKLKLSVKYPILTAAERDALNTAIGDAFFLLHTWIKTTKCTQEHQHIRCTVL